jgi:hypothetical protein
MKKNQILRLLLDARDSATMASADFSEELKSETKSFRETWIISRIDRAIDLITGITK